MFTMRSIRKNLAVIWTAVVILVVTGTSAKAQQQYVDFDVFYNELSPYGNWYNDADYGYVWQPRESNNFQPYYTNGYWAMTEYGNTWVSNYSWGWAPFHYGRWTLGRMGWVWIPGTEWGPAWVEWRQGGGNYGWAPMGPRVQINIAVGGWTTPYDWFVFVPQRNIYNRNFYNYHRPYNHMAIYNKTIIINNYYNDRNNRPVYNCGPRGEDIRRHTGRNVPVYRVTNAETRSATHGARNNEIAIYRPNVRERATNSAPRDVRNYNNTGTSSRDNVGTGSRGNVPATGNGNSVSPRDARRDQPATTNPSIDRSGNTATGTRGRNGSDQPVNTGTATPRIENPGRSVSGSTAPRSQVTPVPRTDNSREVQSGGNALRSQVTPVPRTDNSRQMQSGSSAPRNQVSPAPRTTTPAPDRSVNTAPQQRQTAPAAGGARRQDVAPSVNRGTMGGGRSESRPAMNNSSRDARSSDGGAASRTQGGSRR